jgi:hypothetical protein
MTRYSLVLHLSESVREDKKFRESTQFFADSIANMFNGSDPELRVPVLGGGYNYCIDFSQKKYFDLALKQTKNAIKKFNMDYLTIKTYVYEDEPKERKTRAKKRKKVKK